MNLKRDIIKIKVRARARIRIEVRASRIVMEGCNRCSKTILIVGYKHFIRLIKNCDKFI